MLVKVVGPPKKPDMQVAPELDRSTRLRSYFQEIMMRRFPKNAGFSGLRIWEWFRL